MRRWRYCHSPIGTLVEHIKLEELNDSVCGRESMCVHEVEPLSIIQSGSYMYVCIVYYYTL